MSLLSSEKPSTINLRRNIEVTAFDLESLLVDWLTELLYILEDGLVFGEIRVDHLENNWLRAEIEAGLPQEPPNKHIKAVTYHMLEIKQTKTGYETVLVFDV
jgi:SHS2 domain-containing protein